jgi:hypothetical protein
MDADKLEKECMTGAPCGHQAATFTDDELMDRLRVHAAGCRQKSMTARLTAVIDFIETLLSRGYDRSQARELLTEVGWNFTPDSFDSVLSRVRKRRLRANASGEQSMSMAARKSAAQDGDGASTQTGRDLPRSMAEAFSRASILSSPP